MAYANKIITNPKTGQTIKFLRTSSETGGRYLEMESVFRGHSTEPLLHYHPYQDEKFVVVAGQVRARINGELKTYSAGDQFEVAKNTHHAMWNESGVPATLNWIISPALETEYFFENTIGLSIDGKTNDKGIPDMLQGVLIANRYTKTIRFSKPSFFIQRIIFSILTPIAYLRGYRPSYKKYQD